MHFERRGDVVWGASFWLHFMLASVTLLGLAGCGEEKKSKWKGIEHGPIKEQTGQSGQ